MIKLDSLSIGNLAQLTRYSEYTSRGAGLIHDRSEPACSAIIEKWAKQRVNEMLDQA